MERNSTLLVQSILVSQKARRKLCGSGEQRKLFPISSGSYAHFGPMSLSHVLLRHSADTAIIPLRRLLHIRLSGQQRIPLAFPNSFALQPRGRQNVSSGMLSVFPRVILPRDRFTRSRPTWAATTHYSASPLRKSQAKAGACTRARDSAHRNTAGNS